MPTNRRAATLGALVLCLSTLASGCGGGALATSSQSEQGFAGAALPANVNAPIFSLIDVGGTRVGLAAQRGRVTILAFLYSDCTACVLIAQQIRGALDELSTPPAVLIVSVDTAQDTPARVRSFLHQVSLEGRVHYLVGPADALRAVWRAYHVTTPARGRAAYERAASVLLIDPRGRERVIYEQEQLTPEALAHDIRELQERP
jgi:cytochrome oxidase Cu insertion factor (SCO1/SenC/PrrC family)